ncbi:MAG: exopolysaccharide biosynthesis polyprenyl glycosylphosphotransferase [Lachnospiraceae bacterium]|nr:exopolysaccharide biosynthesis polyprenyl glycosylphosphotransferase [Lachnospiraceae bacterium]
MQELMKKERRWDSPIWIGLKILLYLGLLGTFLIGLGKENHALTTLSRTLGICSVTFIISIFLFVSIYGGFAIGRKKSKPIITSMALATFFTDAITYVELMIMRTNAASVYAFRLRSISWLLAVFVMQVLMIAIFTYGGNELFFAINKPEKSCIVTSSQKKLNMIMRVISKYKKQYKPEAAFDYHEKDICSLIKDYDTVFLYDVPIEKRTEIVRFCYKENINIYYNPELHDIIEVNSEYYMLDDVSFLNYKADGLRIEQRFMKRCLDLALVLFGGIFALPIGIIAAIAIKRFDGGPVFFKQKRATLNGRIFEVYKFRTMKQNVENKSAQKDDDRITKPGHFLRKTRIDELPQLINILKGDMSFVGPRPEMIENVNAYEEQLPEFRYRLRVKGGLTGYAQIAGKYNTTPKDKLVMDIMYIENYNILRDIQLIFQTVGVVLKPDSTEAFGVGGTGEGLKFKYAEGYEPKPSKKKNTK